MKTKKALLIMGCMAVLMLGALTGCTNYMSYTYDNSEKYVAGDQVITDMINNLDIDYVSGDVHLSVGSSNEVTVKETVNKEIENDLKVHTYVDGDTLYVRFCKSTSGIVSLDASKKLEITIPSDRILKSLKIDVSSGDIYADGIDSESVNIDTASGDTTMNAGSVEKLNYDAASGNGKFSFDATPKDSLFDAASGDVSISIPESSDLTVNVDTASGDFTYDLPFKKSEEDIYTLGSGTNKMTIDTASGDVKIGKKS